MLEPLFLDANSACFIASGKLTVRAMPVLIEPRIYLTSLNSFWIFSSFLMRSLVPM